mgnify:CR=1 FL=1
MELEELIVEIVIGLFLLFISYQIGIKENITLLHGYHYTQLDPKDKKVFTKKIGIGTLLVSIGILVMPIINLISHSELGYYIGLTFDCCRSVLYHIHHCKIQRKTY